MNSDFDTLVLNGLRSLSLSGQALLGRDQPPYCYMYLGVLPRLASRI